MRWNARGICLVLTLVDVSILMSCRGQKPSDESSALYKMPTASEVFDLRSKCAALGQKIMQDNIIGPALAQDVVTHYNPRTNRCYVKLEVYSAYLSTPRDKLIDDLYLFDGQTNEVLARASADGSQKSAYIADGLEVTKPERPTGVLANYDDALALINMYMADDRKQ